MEQRFQHQRISEAMGNILVVPFPIFPNKRAKKGNKIANNFA